MSQLCTRLLKQPVSLWDSLQEPRHSSGPALIHTNCTDCLQCWVLTLWCREIRASPALLHPAEGKNSKGLGLTTPDTVLGLFHTSQNTLLCLLRGDLNLNGKITDLNVFIVVVVTIIHAIVILPCLGGVGEGTTPAINQCKLWEAGNLCPPLELPSSWQQVHAEESNTKLKEKGKK